MIPLHDPQTRRSVVAWTLLGIAAVSGCGESTPVTPDGPPAKLQPKIKRLQDVKPKPEAAKK